MVLGLHYEVLPARTGVNATGPKPCYYSLNRRTGHFGYAPEFTSLGGALDTVRQLLRPAMLRLYFKKDP